MSLTVGTYRHLFHWEIWRLRGSMLHIARKGIGSIQVHINDLHSSTIVSRTGKINLEHYNVVIPCEWNASSNNQKCLKLCCVPFDFGHRQVRKCALDRRLQYAICLLGYHSFLVERNHWHGAHGAVVNGNTWNHFWHMLTLILGISETIQCTCLVNIITESLWVNCMKNWLRCRLMGRLV